MDRLDLFPGPVRGAEPPEWPAAGVVCGAGGPLGFPPPDWRSCFLRVWFAETPEPGRGFAGPLGPPEEGKPNSVV